jgi:hypothetical protein
MHPPTESLGTSRAAWALAIAATLVALMGILHAKAARPLLAKLGIACPVRAGTPEEVDRARAFGSAA